MASSIKPVPSNFTIVESIDTKKAIDIFIKYHFSDSAQELGLEYLNEILQQLKIYTADVGYADRQQSRLEIFQRFVKALDEFDACLEELDQPRLRHSSDRESIFRIDQAGTGTFRKVMARLFAQFYTPDSNLYQTLHYADFQEFETTRVNGRPLRPPMRPEAEQIFTGFRIDEFRDMITASMIPISRQLLNCLKKATLAAIDEMNSAKNLKGGQGRNPLELGIIRVLAELWYRAFNGKRSIYANASNPDLLDFINQNCALLGLPNIATEYAIKQVRPMVMERLVATNTR